MLRAIAFGLAAGAGFQAWRQYPPDGPTTTRALALVLVVGVVLAYLAGRWRDRQAPSATAVAVANADATAVAANQVNLAVVVPGSGPGRAVAMPWLDGHAMRPEITADDLDGLDLSEFRDQASHAGHEETG